MNIHSNNKNTSVQDQEKDIPVSDSDTLQDTSDEAYELEIAAMQDEDAINLDDALDDDNENPVSHTLVDAAENSGSEEIRDTQELEGEEQESKDRTGSLSPLYKET